MSAATKDRTAGEKLETQGGRLLVSLERWVNRKLKFAQEIEAKKVQQERPTRWRRRNANRSDPRPARSRARRCGIRRQPDGYSRARSPRLSRCD
jgi:hypothetical protein